MGLIEMAESSLYITYNETSSHYLVLEVNVLYLDGMSSKYFRRYI